MTLTTVEQSSSPSLAQMVGNTIAIILTVETSLWLLLGLVALGMRLFTLGDAPLAEHEAALAYEAWRFVMGLPYEMNAPVLSPLAFNLDALFFLLFGASDAAARIAQAFGGTLLILSAWLFRPLLGRGHALGMAILLFLSPAVLFWSRQASGEIWAALCLLVLVASVARWWRGRDRRDGTLAAVALGIGLASGPGFWSGLVAGGLFLLLRWRFPQIEFATEMPVAEKEEGPVSDAEEGPVSDAEEVPIPDTEEGLVSDAEEASDAEEVPVSKKKKKKKKKKGASSKQDAETESSYPRQALFSYGSIAVIAFIITSTAFLTNVQGLGAALNLPVQWLLALIGNGTPLALPFFLSLLLYEGLIVVLGIIGGILIQRAQPDWALFGSLWALFTLLPATLLNTGWAAGLLFVTLPFALLGGAVIVTVGRELLQSVSPQIEGGITFFSLALFLYGWINLASYIAGPTPIKLAVSLVVPLVGLLSITIVLANTYSIPTAKRTLSLTLLLLFAIISFTNGWGVSTERAFDPREPMVVSPSSPNLRTAAEQLGKISIERYRNPGDIALGIQKSLGHAPLWYFRHFEDVTFVDGSHATLPEASLLDDQQPIPPNAIGQRVWLGNDWQWPITEHVGLLRWLKNRGEPGGIISRSAVLYVSLP